jgi:hypothetical protein
MREMPNRKRSDEGCRCQSESKGVCQHFERATQILICKTEASGCRLAEIRQIRPPCGTRQDKPVP